MQVAVVGGGVIGLCVARSLQRRGAEVTVIDRGRCGAATSAGNAGWVTPGLSAPIPAPGVVRQALRWMLDSESPFLIRPRLDPGLISWGLAFTRASSPRRYREGLRAALDFARTTPAVFDELRADGVEFEMHEDGLLFLVRDERKLDEWVRMYEELAELGFDGRVERFDRAGVRELEPAVGDAVAAGLLARVERHVRPESLSAGLRARLRAGGARIEEQAEVTAIERAGASWQVRTPGGSLAADRVVVAAGIWTSRLLAPLGVRAPMQAAKGYSVTAPAGDPSPRHPLYLTEAKIGVSPFAGELRLAGTLELAGLDLSLNRRRIDAVVRNANRYIRFDPPADARAEWAGLRPVAPDGLPIVGPVPGRDGLYVATGHAMMGITLGPATGEALAPLVLENRLSPELRPLGLERFMRRPARSEAGRLREVAA